MHAFSFIFNQQPNSCLKSRIKALPNQYLLVQCQPAMETPEQCAKYVQKRQRQSHCGCSGTFAVNCQNILHFLVFPLLTFNKIKTNGVTSRVICPFWSIFCKDVIINFVSEPFHKT